MKVSKSVAHTSALIDGDQILVSVTHQVVIDGSDAWVKYEASSKVRPGESVEDADHRVIDHVSRQVIAVANEAAAQVMKHNR